MKKIGTKLLAAVVASSLIVTPVMASPSVNDLKEDKAKAENEVQDLQEQLNDIMTKLNSLEEELIQKGEDIAQAEVDLEAAEEKEKEQYEAMKKRIKYMYEEGDLTAFETLVSSENFSDLLNKAEYVQDVHTYDREQLQEYVETKQQITDLKTQLEEDEKKLESTQDEYEAKEAELNTTIESKKAEVADLDEKIQEAARKAEEERRRQEEERQRQEEERQRQAETARTNNTVSNSGNNSSGSSSSGSSSSVNSNSGGSSSGSSSSGSSGSSHSGLSTGNTVVDRAYSQLGKPYSWGATGPNSFDCSGFVGYCLTGSFSRIGTTMTFMGWTRVSNPQPGDVVTTATHCGIYIGNGMMIHAPHKGDVVKISAVQSGMIYVRP